MQFQNIIRNLSKKPLYNFSYKRISDRLQKTHTNYNDFLKKKSTNVKLDNIQKVYTEKFPIQEFDQYQYSATPAELQNIKMFMEGFGAQTLTKIEYNQVLYSLKKINPYNMETRHL